MGCGIPYLFYKLSLIIISLLKWAIMEKPFENSFHFLSESFFSYDSNDDIVDQLQSMMHLKTPKTCMRRFDFYRFQIKNQDYILKYISRIRFPHIHIEYFIDDLQMMLF